MIKRTIIYSVTFFLTAFLFCQCRNRTDKWILVQQDITATVFLPETSSGPVKLAVQDLVSDVEKITGKRMAIIRDPEQITGNAIIVANMEEPAERELVSQINPDLDSLAGKWESYAVYREKAFQNMKNPLLMVGSDERGTLFAIYHFIEKYLKVDPFYYWSGMEPEKRKELVFDEIEIIRGQPATKPEWTTQFYGLNGGYAFGEFTFNTKLKDPTVTFKLIDENGNIIHELKLKRSELTPANY